VQQEPNQLVDHLFRTEAGKMTAVLTRLFGFKQHETAEDIVHDTIYQALETWRFNRVPDNPTAWLYRVAKNKAIDHLRRENRMAEITSELKPLLKSEYTLPTVVNHYFNENEIADSQLRMMFAACHPAIPEEAQIALVLKALCGFSIEEIAHAFLSNKDAIEKRLYRAKEKIREANIQLDVPVGNDFQTRLETVLQCIYLLFNEGYNSSTSDSIIRKDLCYEAIRLCILLTENEPSNLPETNALLALMCYNASRFDARIDSNGLIVLLQNQDRSKWDKELMLRGQYYLNISSSGQGLSTYHLEAAISSMHCMADSFEQTNWKAILGMYNLLAERKPSPVVLLNRAIALSFAESKQVAIEEIKKLDSLKNHYLYNAALGDLYFDIDKLSEAKAFYETALKQTQSLQERELLKKKLSLASTNQGTSGP
jgi:RNA polymerase sigma factor (sigma-70 family)